MTRWIAVLGLLVACAEGEEPEACSPGAARCLDDDAVQYCTGDGSWGPEEPFVCLAGECVVQGTQAVCK